PGSVEDGLQRHQGCPAGYFVGAFRRAAAMRKPPPLQIAACRLQIAKHSFNLQSAICNLKFIFVLLCLLTVPAIASASEEMPRGDGFYFSIPKLLTLVAVYLVWIATVRWVDQDAIDLDLPATTWSTLMFGAGFLGLVIVWLLPWYWISLVLLLILYAIAGISYVNVRNQKVPAELRVLTSKHIQD